MTKEWDEVEEGGKRQVMGEIELYLSELHGPADFNDMFLDYEAVFKKSGTRLNWKTDDPTYDGLSLIGTGVPFSFFEQYMIIDEYGLRLGGYAIISVFLIVSLFSRNLTVGFGTSFVVATTMFELVGLLGLAGIKMSALPVVTILSCIGIIVEFVGHIANSFAVGPEGVAWATGEDRMVFCLETVALPIIDGSISTLLGIVMLGASKFAFVRRYFFLPYVIIVALGGFNGLVFLPLTLNLSWDAMTKLTGRGKGRNGADDSVPLVGGQSTPKKIASVQPVGGEEGSESGKNSTAAVPALQLPVTH